MRHLPRNHYGAILADPPWAFRVWSKSDRGRTAAAHYSTMPIADICALPVADIAAKDSVLFLWASWPQLEDALALIKAWGFTFKTCAFCWTKAHAGQIEMFESAIPDQMGMGYWTRANTEACLLATRGKPKRLNADVRQAIIEPRREHSRKPDCVHDRIERLVAGPYLELFARAEHPGWMVWRDETGRYSPRRDLAGSIDDCYAAIRQRKANGGPGWEPQP